MPQLVRTRNVLLAALVFGVPAVGISISPRPVFADAAASESPATPEKSPTAARNDDGIRVTTPAREAAAITFARRHHPELADLLERLQRGNPRQYGQAILELFRTSERLARIEERDPERYEMALELWKLDSRIQLRAARMAMSADPELEAELKTLLLQRNEWKIRQMMLDRDRAEARLKRLNKQIFAAQRNPGLAAERELRRLKRVVGAAADARKNRKQKAAGKGRKAVRKSAEPPSRPRRQADN